MNIDKSKMTLSAEALASVQTALPVAIDQHLNAPQPPANLQGFAAGVKFKNGIPTGEPAVLALVTQKIAPDQLSPQDLIPRTINGVKTDVLEVGYITAQAAGTRARPQQQTDLTISRHVGDGYVRMGEQVLELPEVAAPAVPTIEVLTKRARPVRGGYSVGHFRITAGTIATCVYDMLPEATTIPPAPGIGIPPKYYVLSNNHVLANSNAASPGDPILQPGPYDGGADPADRIARLSRFVPITFEPPIPRAQHRNLVDCAVAEGDFQDLDREIYWTSLARGWRPRAAVAAPRMIGEHVKKTGRTTNLTFGEILAVSATVDVGYGGGRVARFTDQIITTAMSAPGDSGSLLLTLDNVAIGLLFAGSTQVTIFNHIEYVRSLLHIEVADQVL